MRSRWLGMMLLGLAVVLGTPVVTSFLVRLSCPAPISMPPGRSGEDRRFLERGALVQHRFVYDETTFQHTRAQGSPFSFRWTRKPEISDICVPVWPMPPVFAGIGVLAWRKGAGRMGPILARMKGPRAQSRWARFARLALAGLGLTTGCLIALSFLSLGGISTFRAEGSI